jgi:hypothetical protein
MTIDGGNMRKTIFVGSFVAIIFVSCSTFPSFYTPYFDARTVPGVVLLGPNEEPQIYSSNNIIEDGNKLLSQNYVCVGETSFNGPMRNIINDIKYQCKQNGAIIALYQIVYTDTIHIERQPRRNYNGNTGNGGHASVLDVLNSVADFINTVTVIAGDIDRYNFNVFYFVKKI